MEWEVGSDYLMGTVFFSGNENGIKGLAQHCECTKYY